MPATDRYAKYYSEDNLDVKRVQVIIQKGNQRGDQLAANSMAVRNFIEDTDLFMVNQDHRQLQVWDNQDVAILILFYHAVFLLSSILYI